MSRIDLVAATITTIAEHSINSEICGIKLCRLLGFERVWPGNSCLVLRFSPITAGKTHSLKGLYCRFEPGMVF